MPTDRGLRYVPYSLLAMLRHSLLRERSEDDPTGYQNAASVLEKAYAEGYADGWLRGHDEGYHVRRVDGPAPERGNGG